GYQLESLKCVRDVTVSNIIPAGFASGDPDDDWGSYIGNVPSGAWETDDKNYAVAIIHIKQPSKEDVLCFINKNDSTRHTWISLSDLLTKVDNTTYTAEDSYWGITVTFKLDGNTISTINFNTANTSMNEFNGDYLAPVGADTDVNSSALVSEFTITQVGETHTFTMPAYPVTVTAKFKVDDGAVAKAKTGAKEEIDVEAGKDPLKNGESVTNGKAEIDKATTYYEVENAKETAIRAIRRTQAKELEEVKAQAKASLDTENGKDPLNDDASVVNGKESIESATTKALAESAKDTAIKAIQGAQASELASAKEQAKASLDTEDGKDPLNDKASLTTGKSNIDGANTKSAVGSAKDSAVTAIREAQASELAKAKEDAKALLDAEDDIEPLADKTAVTSGKSSIDGATTKAGVATAKDEAISEIQSAQPNRLEEAKNQAKALLDEENAKDPLLDETALQNGK
nr:hypothetical protein [Clostridia bacterium]